jgi:hypothetical protein
MLVTLVKVEEQPCVKYPNPCEGQLVNVPSRGVSRIPPSLKQEYPEETSPSL